MANNYYDGTGVLVLDKVTPVIRALFGGFKIDPDVPGDGKAYICEIAESNDPVWDGVRDELVELAGSLNIPLPEQGDADIGTVLEVLAEHFDSDDDDLANLIEHHNFEGYADLDALFLIATCFDDGHNLTAIQFEGCWHCSKPRLFEFGGNGSFISRQVALSITSTQAVALGEKLHQALTENDLNAAAALIVGETEKVLAGINDPDVRDRMRKLVAELVSREPSIASAD